MTATVSAGRSRAVVAVAASALGLGLVVTVATDLVAPLVLVVLGLVGAAIARSTGWRVAFAMTLVTGMAVELCFLRLTPVLGVDPGTADLVLWTLCGAAAVAWLALRGLPSMSRFQAESLACVLLVPAAGTLLFLTKYLASGRTWIGWSMNNDVAFKSLMVRWTLDDGGLTASRGYSDPMTSTILAAWSAGAAGAGDLSHRVAAIVHADAQLWLLLWLTVSAAGSVLALRNVRAGLGYRVIVAVAAGLIPWTWFLAGASFELGFQNVAPAVLVIVLGWILWIERERHPATCLAGLFLTTLAAATSWAPLASVPFAWALCTVALEHRTLRAAPRRDLLLPIGSLAVCVAYASLVTVPEVLGSGTGGLSGDGAIQALRWQWVLGLTAAGLMLSLVFRRRLGATLRWGLWCAVAASALSVAYLLYQRRDSAVLWGYYPIKFSWLMISAALIVCFGELASALARTRPWPWRTVGIVLAVPAVVAAMLQMTPAWAPGSKFTPLALVQDERHDRSAAAVFHILDVHPKSFVVGYSPGRWAGPGQDGFINFWLFQMLAEKASDPVRVLAYHFDSSNASEVCHDVRVWGTGVEMWTRKRQVAARFARACASDDVAVRLRGRLVPQAAVAGRAAAQDPSTPSS